MLRRLGCRMGLVAAFALSTMGAAFAVDSMPPPANTDVRKAIDEGNAKYVEAYAHSDPAAFADVYDADGTRLGDRGDGSVTRGHDAIAQDVAQFMKAVDGFVKVTADTQRLYVVDDLAYEEGKYALTFTLKRDGKEQQLKGQYVTVWKKQKDGGWKIWADMPVPQT